jgi:hypothetical protein
MEQEVVMIASELLAKLQQLVDAGHGDQEVYLDTNPHDLHIIGDIDLDGDEVGIIIWKA